MTQFSAFGTHGNGATGPASSASYSGPWTAGLYFKVTQASQYLYGFYLWRADSSQSASATFALWTVTASGTGTVIPATEVSGSGFTAGAWNFVPLPSPFLLTSGTVYMAVYGYTAGNFPETKPEFGTGGTYAAGIVNGPLTVFAGNASAGGTGPQAFGSFYAQGSFSVAGSSASGTLPSSDDGQANFWVDILVGPAQVTAAPQGLSQAIRARPLAVPRAGAVSAELAPGTGNVSGPLNGAGSGNGTGASGAPVRNPSRGPLFRQAVQAVRAREPQQPFLRGRCYSSPGAPVRNPAPGPVFRSKAAPVRYVLPPWRPRAGRIGSNSGAPVANPAHGPPAYALRGPVRAALPLPPHGRTAGTRAVPAPAPLVPAPLYPLQRPVRAPVPATFSRGRVSSSPGAPARNPSPGPVFTPAAAPVQARRPLPLRGRTASNAGAPVRNPTPPGTGPVFYPRNTAKAQLPLPRRGTCRAIRFGSLPANPTTGPVFTQAVTPARARTPLPPRGRIASNPGAPVRNPVPPVLGPVFFPARQAIRIRPSLPPRGRTAGGQGAPVRNPAQGAAFPAARSPVQARFPLPPRGRTSGNPGIPVPPPVIPAPLYPLHGPVAARIPLPPRGRISGNSGRPVANPVTRTGPPFIPLHWPARIRPSLPPRGRVSANPGAVVRNPRPGPAFTQAVRPIRAVIPQNAPRGRTGSNPGGPVANIPFGNPLFRTGQPRFQWDTEVPGFQWETASPGFAWATGVPVTS